MLKQLRLKFIVVNMTIVTIMLSIIFGVVFHTIRGNMVSESIRMMQRVSGEPVHPGIVGNIPEEIRLPFFILDISLDGEVVAAGGGYYDLSDREFLVGLVDQVIQSDEPLGVIHEYNLRFLRAESPRGERVVFADISSEQSTIQNLIRNSLLIGGASFFAFLLISVFLARWAVKPVEKAWEQQRQFVADASHELKTPLTVITTNAELLQGPAGDENARLQFSGAILTMSRQMRRLTENLLDLARVDNGQVKTAFTRVDFSQTVSDAILPFETVYFEKGLSMETEIDAGIALNGSQNHLRQVVEILMDNAQKYSDQQGKVKVTLKKQGKSCLLSVANPGETISKEDLKNIFKRFYRIDPARTHDGSYGLGLSIAESIVSEHRGRIWAESDGGINVFFVQLPTV